METLLPEQAAPTGEVARGLLALARVADTLDSLSVAELLTGLLPRTPQSVREAGWIELRNYLGVAHTCQTITPAEIAAVMGYTPIGEELEYHRRAEVWIGEAATTATKLAFNDLAGYPR